MHNPQGFKPLTKSSRSNSPTLSNQLYPMPEIYTKVYPDWTCVAPNPDRGGSLQHRRGLNPQPGVRQPSNCCTLAPEGFEPLTKGS